MIDLKPLHTFGFSYQASQLLIFASSSELIDYAREQALFDQPHIILGEGSNTVFLSDFDGVVVQFQDECVEVSEDDDYYYLTVGAGMNWHQLVCWCVQNGFYGLENLALIPGKVGAAPIQNIGAYGVEFGEICQFVEVLNKSDLSLVKMPQSALKLGYRDSIFKHELKDQVVITKVGFKLAKKWQATNQYSGLHGLTNAVDIFNQVIHIRQSKLPDPQNIPNAGSFFKNAVVGIKQFEQLQLNYPTIPSFAISATEVKIPSAWLIEQCQLKGYEVGGVRVFPDHALVLTNHAQGSGADLLALIEHIQQQVVQKFAIELQPEVQLIR